MPTRTRERFPAYATPGRILRTGYGWSQAVYATGSNLAISYDRNADTTMPKPYVVDHPLDVQHKRAQPLLRLNGVIPYFGISGNKNQYGLTYQDYNPANRTGYIYCPDSPSIDFSYWKTKALANLNPEKPVVDLPLFLWELKDLPQMIRHAGWILKGLKSARYRHHWDDVGAIHLAYQFGWAPLASDLLQLFGLTEKIEERKRYLRSLESGTYIRRKLYDDILTSTTTTNGYTVSGPGRPFIYRADIKYRTTQKIWFTCNGKLKDPLPNDGQALQSLSQDIVLGLRFNPERVWDFIPWTWLSDYFVNLGDYLEAFGTLSRLEVTRMNIMAETVASSTLEETYIESGLSATPSSLKTHRKLRAVYSNPTPSIALTPFLTTKQISILGALVSTRSKRATRY